MANRMCRDCGVDISHLHGNARRCPDCRAKINPPSDRKCSNGDGKPVVARDLCDACYSYTVRHNGPFARATAEEVFWSRVDKDGPLPVRRPELGPCWVWTNALDDNGYGSITINGQRFYAHRYSYALLVEPIPDGLQIDHLCRNRACVRPDHLDPTTNRENTIRGDAPRLASERGRAVKKCKRYGHPFDEENTYWHNGRRHCKACARIRREARDAREKAERHARGLKKSRATIPGMCSRDLHLMEGDNVYLGPDGRTRCRACHRDDQRKYLAA